MSKIVALAFSFIFIFSQPARAEIYLLNDLGKWVEISRYESADLIQINHRLEALRYKLKSKRSDLYPVLTSEMNTNRLKKYGSIPGLSQIILEGRDSIYQSDFYLNLSLNLYKGGGDKAELSLIRMEFDELYAEKKIVEQRLLIKLIDLIQKKVEGEGCNEREEILTGLRSRKELIEVKRSVLGLSASNAILDRKISNTDAEIKKLACLEELDLADFELAKLFKISASTKLRFSSDSNFPSDEYFRQFDDVIGGNSVNLLELILHKRDIKKSMESLESRIIKSQYRPSVDAFASYSASNLSEDSFSDSLSGLESDDLTLGVKASWRIFDGFKRSSLIGKSRSSYGAQYEQINDEYESTLFKSKKLQVQERYLIEKIKNVEGSLKSKESKLLIGEGKFSNGQVAKIKVDEKRAEWREELVRLKILRFKLKSIELKIKIIKGI